VLAVRDLDAFAFQVFTFGLHDSGGAAAASSGGGGSSSGGSTNA